jgi:hypothetical protein
LLDSGAAIRSSKASLETCITGEFTREKDVKREGEGTCEIFSAVELDATNPLSGSGSAVGAIRDTPRIKNR